MQKQSAVLLDSAALPFYRTCRTENYLLIRDGIWGLNGLTVCKQGCRSVEGLRVPTQTEVANFEHHQKFKGKYHLTSCFESKAYAILEDTLE